MILYEPDFEVVISPMIMTVKVYSSLLNDYFSRSYITNDKFLLLERQLVVPVATTTFYEMTFNDKFQNSRWK